MSSNKWILNAQSIAATPKKMRNVLSGFLSVYQLPVQGANETIDEAGPAHHFVLEPHVISALSTLSDNGDLVFTTVIGNGSSLAYYTLDGNQGNVILKPTNAVRVAASIGDLIGAGVAEKSKTALIMTPDGLAVLGALVDLKRREMLENLVLHMAGASGLTLENIQEAYLLGLESADLRWFLPAIVEVLTPFKNPEDADIKKGLKDLAKLGLISSEKSGIDLTEQGNALIAFLNRSMAYTGVKSLFYHEDRLQLMSVFFLRIDTTLYQIMPIDEGIHYSFSSIDYGKFEEVLAIAIAPGDAPPVLADEKPEAPTDVKMAPSNTSVNSIPKTADSPSGKGVQAPVGSPAPKFCKHCGMPISAGAKFCKQCGKPVASGEKVQS